MGTTESKHKEIVQKLPEAVNEGNLDHLTAIVADEYVSHNPVFPEPLHGPEELKKAFSIFCTAFPDLEYTVEDVTAEGDKVVRRDRVTGTHDGPLMEVIEPTGQEVELEGIGIYRIEDGQLAESWSHGETPLTQQLDLDARYTEVIRRTSFRNIVASQVHGTHRATLSETTAEFEVDNVVEAAAVDYLFQSERPVLTDLLEELQRGDVFFDIGANFGLYTCLAAKVLDMGDVYPVEPYSPNLPRLRRNLEANGASGDRIVNKAFADVDGELAFDPPDPELALRGTSRIRASETDADTVDAIRGDTFCSDDEVPPPDVLKIDVEGAELKVLKGLRETLTSSTCRVLYCELHEEENDTPLEDISMTDYGANKDDVESLLNECGYDVETLQRRLGERHIKATK